MNQNSIHPGIKQIISEYLNIVDGYNPELLEGFYLYGSVALGDFSLKLSDIDFIAVSKNRLTKEDIVKLDGIHQMIRKAYPKPSLEGIYVTWEDLGELNDVEPYPYYHEGKMHESGLFECNPVTWHELTTCGIAIQGPEVTELNITQDWGQLIKLMHENLNSYWLNWIKQSSKRMTINSVTLLFSKAAVEWGVLGITRLFYTFRENQITSKARAGEYALGVVPERWHRIIQESINYRRGLSKSLYRSVWKRRADALAYMNYILNECNKMN